MRSSNYFSIITTVHNIQQLAWRISKDYNNGTKDVACGLITTLIKILTKTTVAKDIRLVLIVNAIINSVAN